MAAVKLLDFEDIYTAVLEEIGEQTSNTNALNKVKRYVNMIYVDEVVPFKDWKWLRKRTDIIHKAAHNDDSCQVTPSSATVTLNTAPQASLGSFANYKFSVDGFAEIYDILSHTAGSATVTLSSAYQGPVSTTATYKIWRDRIDLPTNCLRTFQLDHDHHGSQMKGVGYQELQKRMKDYPKLEGHPVYYHTTDFYDPDTTGDDETESDRYRQAIIYPAIHATENCTLHVDYIQEVTELDVAGDEPLMPIGDRIVLFYGAVAYAWKNIARNPEEHDRAWAQFQRKLERMSSELEDGFDMPSIGVSTRYRNRLRSSRLGQMRRSIDGFSSPSSGSNPNITFAEDIIIKGASLTDDMTVATGVEIIFSDYTAGSVLFIGSSQEVQEDNSNFFWDDSNDELQVTNISVTTGLSLDSFTQGSVIFVGANGDLTEDNTNLFWDDSNNILTAAELNLLSSNPQITFRDNGAGDGDINASIDVNATDVGAGTEDADFSFKQQIAGTLTEVLFIDADGDLETVKNISIDNSSPGLQFKDSDASDGDVNASIVIAATDTGSGTEDADISFNQQIAGALTEVLFIDADGDIETIKNLTIENANPTIQFKDTDGTDADINASIDVNLTDTGSGSEDADISFKQQVAGTLTETLLLDADGSAHFKVPIVLESQNLIRLQDSDNSNFIAIQVPSSLSGDTTFTLPDGDGSANQALITNGSGTLSWGSTDTVSSTGNVDFNFIDEDTTDDDIGVVLRANATDTGSGTEDVDFTILQQIAGSLTAVLVLDADGGATLSKDLTIDNSGQIFLPDGSASDPAYTFSSDPDTGIYQTGTANQLAFCTNGTQRILIQNTRIDFAEPIASSHTDDDTIPHYSHAGDTNSGYGFYTNDELQLRANASEINRMTETVFSFFNNQEIRLFDTGSSDYIGLKAPSALTASQTFTLPDADGTAGQVLQTDGSGVMSWKSASSGGKNYLSGDDVDFEGGTTGTWATFDDGSVATPVDGTGGSPANVSIAVTTTSGEVLEKTTSLEITKANTADSQGEGVSVDFDIDYGEQEKAQYISFMMKSGSGFVNGLFQMFIYDVTNGSVINVHTLDGGSGELYATPSTGTKVHGTWFPVSDSTSYRFIIMCNGTDTDNFDFTIDEIKIGPIATISSYNAEYLGDIGLTGNLTTNATYTCQAWRQGDRLKGFGKIAFAGTNTDGTATINLPYTIDTAKILDTSAIRDPIGQVTVEDSGTDRYLGTVLINNSTSIYLVVDDGDGTYSTVNTSTNNPITIASGDKLVFSFDVPISGWDVSDVMSTHQADLRSLKCKAYLSGTQNVTATVDTLIEFDTTAYDTHGIFDTSNNQATIPYSGYYEIILSVKVSGSTSDDFHSNEIKVNGSLVDYEPNDMNSTSPASRVTYKGYLTKGDVVTFTSDSQTDNNYNVSGGSESATWCSIYADPDFSVFGVKGIYNYQYIEITSQPTTTSADTPVASTETLTLPSGTWTIGYNVPLKLSELSGSLNGTVQGSVHIYNETDSAILDRSHSYKRIDDVPANGIHVSQQYHEVEITITKETEFSVRVVSEAADTDQSWRIDDTDLTPNISDDDGSSILFARVGKS